MKKQKNPFNKALHLNPYSLSTIETRDISPRKNRCADIPPLNKLIRDRMEGLNIPHQVIRKALHVSRSYAYRIKQGIFPTFYKQKLALSEIIGIPLKTLVLMEHGFEVDIPKNNLPELKEKLKGDLKTLAERHSLPGGVIASLLKKQVDSRRGY